MPRLRVRVHLNPSHALNQFLIFAERTGLPKHVIDQRCFPMIDVSDNGDIAYVISLLHKKLCLLSENKNASSWFARGVYDVVCQKGTNILAEFQLFVRLKKS